MTTCAVTMMSDEPLKKRAAALGLFGLLANWDKVDHEPWIKKLLLWEEEERSRRSLERRIASSRLGAFKPLSDFDWSWPTKCDRALIEELMQLEFITEPRNVILMGPSGVGKTTIAQNLIHQTLLSGRSAMFVNASQMLGDLCAIDSPSILRSRLNLFARQAVIAIDEVGYLSYSNRHADILFQIIDKRFQNKATVITTNRPFAEWKDAFPGAACVVGMLDRLMQNADTVQIAGQSYRLKTAKENNEQRAIRRRGRPK